MRSKTLKTLHKVIKYLIRPKEYFQTIQLCGAHTEWITKLITIRLQEETWRGKEIACFSVYSSVGVYQVCKSKYKFFYTQENTHVKGSNWQPWEDCYLWKNSPTLSMGFDYIEHPKYIRFPYWLNEVFKADVTKEQVEDFVKQHTISDSASREKSCAFICRNDYYGDRAQLANFVEQVMPMSYPSNFRHNDDDLHGKYKDKKVEYLHQFKFNLCPENSNNRGYVTEKIFQAIIAGCVPIYWGNEGYPEPDILNPKAIVYLDKDNPAEGLILLRKLYENPKAYAEFASQPRFLPGAADKIYAYYVRLEEKLREVLREE